MSIVVRWASWCRRGRWRRQCIVQQKKMPMLPFVAVAGNEKQLRKSGGCEKQSGRYTKRVRHLRADQLRRSPHGKKRKTRHYCRGRARRLQSASGARKENSTRQRTPRTGARQLLDNCRALEKAWIRTCPSTKAVLIQRQPRFFRGCFFAFTRTNECHENRTTPRKMSTTRFSAARRGVGDGLRPKRAGGSAQCGPDVIRFRDTGPNLLPFE